MKLFVRVQQRSQNLRALTVPVGPQRSQYARSWHSSSVFRLKRRKGEPSFAARKSADTALHHWGDEFRDHVTVEALKNLGCRSPHVVFVGILGVSSYYMSDKKTPDQVKGSIVSTLIWSTEKLTSRYEAEPNLEKAVQYRTAVGDLEALSREPAIASEAIYLIAHRLWNCQDLKSAGSRVDILPLAKWMLTLALEMGNLKAALDLAHVASLNPDGVIPPAALRLIRAAAVEHTDSRAMAIYARYLLSLRNAANPSTRKDALELALQLSLVSEPANPSTAIRLTATAFHKWEAPWILVRDAARQQLEIDYPSPADPQHQQINQVFVEALREGVNSYDDPEAARDLSDHPDVEEFSDEWIALKTTSAMHGHQKSCYDLARYYIEYWGLYPCTGKAPSDNPEARIGLDWLELSAEAYHDDADEMQRRYLLLALLSRENRMHNEGHAAVKRGIDAIDQYTEDTRGRTAAIKQLQDFDRNWDFNFSARVEALLGADATPKLKPKQRHQSLLQSRR